MIKLDSAASVLHYIEQHEVLFSFKPHMIYVNEQTWHNIKEFIQKHLELFEEFRNQNNFYYETNLKLHGVRIEREL